MKGKRILSAILVFAFVFGMFGASAFAAEEEVNTPPKAEVSRLEAMTLTQAEHDYMCWPNGDDTVDRPHEIVVNFKAKETAEEVKYSPWKKWKVDFYLQSHFTEEETEVDLTCGRTEEVAGWVCTRWAWPLGTWLLPPLSWVPVFSSSFFWCLFESVTTMGLAHGMHLRRRWGCWGEFKAVLTGMILRLT